MALVVLALLLFPAPNLRRDAAASPCAGVTRDGNFRVITLPELDPGDLRGTHHAAHPTRPGEYLATDGTVLHRTKDGGCTWSELWRIPASASSDFPFDDELATIVDVQHSANLEGANRVHLLVEVLPTGLPGERPSSATVFVVSTYDDGATWERHRGGLTDAMTPATGPGEPGYCSYRARCALRVGADDADVLYLTVASAPLSQGMLYRSDDGGQTWAARNPYGDPAGNAAGGGIPLPLGGLDGLFVNAADSDHLLLRGDGLAESFDGGLTWTFTGVDTYIQTPVLGAAPGESGLDIVVLDSANNGYPTGVWEFNRRVDGQVTSVEEDAIGLGEVLIESGVVGDRIDDVVIATAEPDGLLGWSPRRETFADLDPDQVTRRLGPVRNVRHDGGEYTLLGSGVLLVYEGPTGDDLPVTGTVTVDLGDDTVTDGGDVDVEAAFPPGGETPIDRCPAGGDVVSLDGWTVATPPELPGRGTVGAVYDEYYTPPPAIVDVAVSADDPARMWITNGLAIARSVDAGCTWETVWVLEDDAPAEFGEVVKGEVWELITPPRPGGGDQIHAVLAPSLGTSLVTVVSSHDGGDTWGEGEGARASAGTNLSDRCDGEDCAVAIAPGDPDRLVLATSTPLGKEPSPGALPGEALVNLRVSDDGGRTWRTVTGPTQPLGTSISSDVADIAISATDPDEILLLLDGSAVQAPFLSRDGGQTFEPATEFKAAEAGRLVLAATAPTATDGGNEYLVIDRGAYGNGVHGLLRSRDGGRTVTSVPMAGVDGDLLSLAVGETTDDIVVTTTTGVWFYIARSDLWVDLDVVGLVVPELDTSLRDASPTWSGERRRLYFQRHGEGVTREQDAVAWVDLADLPPLVVPLEPVRDFSVPPLLDPDPAFFTPASVDVELEFGERVVREVDLVVPAAPTPLDVFFLMDASGSMGDDHRALANQFERIVRELSDARVPVEFGLGIYRDLGERYRRLFDIAPPSEELVRRMYAIEANGGTEPAYTALRQMATGQGIQAPVTGNPVPAGEQANFRDGARRYVVHVTDEPLQPDPPHGDPVTAVLDLNARDIGHIGLVADPPTGLPAVDAATIDPQMRVVSLGTRTLAPGGGVDCDSDGTADLNEGEPIVCRIPRRSSGPDLATPLLEILASLVDEHEVQLVSSDPELVPSIVPASRVIDVTEDQRVGVEFEVTCPASRAGDRADVTLEARLRGVTIAVAQVRVGCGVPVAPVALTSFFGVPPMAGPAVAVPLVLAPPLPPAVPVPALGAAPSLATSASAAGATSAASSSTSAGASAGASAGVGAAAPDEEQQAAGAVALEPWPEQDGSVLASRVADPVPGIRLAGIVVLTIATSLAARSRQAVTRLRRSR